MNKAMPNTTLVTAMKPITVGITSGPAITLAIDATVTPMIAAGLSWGLDIVPAKLPPIAPDTASTAVLISIFWLSHLLKFKKWLVYSKHYHRRKNLLYFTNNKFATPVVAVDSPAGSTRLVEEEPKRL